MTHWQIFLCVLIALLTLPLSMRLQAESTLHTDVNLLDNGTFEKIDGRGVPQGWKIGGAVAEIKPMRIGNGPHRTLLKITTKGQGVVRLEQTINAPGPADLLVSLRVRGNGKAVMRAGSLAMAYHDQGNPQRVIGMIRHENTGSVTLSVSLSSLNGRPAEFLLTDVRVQTVNVASEPPARLPVVSATTLIKAGQPNAMIVIPADDATSLNLANRINDVIAKLTGASLPVITAKQAVMSGTAALTNEVADRHLILIGRLGTNRAIWTAYNRFLAAVDGYYPGGDGYVVRTAIGVTHGRNHLILGGSSDAGVEQAVDRFVDHLSESPIENRTLTVPALLDIELGGQCLDAMQAREALWNDDPNNRALPPVQSGYGTVRRWYENAMSFYWTGWDSYRQRVRQMTDQVIADDADTHHYLLEFFVNAYDMIDNADLLSQPQRHGLDRLLLKNLLHMTTGPDVSWMTTFSPPYDSILLSNRHAIAPWAADLRVAEFMLDRFGLTGDLADLVTFREHEKRAFMRDWLDHRWAVSMPGAMNTEHEEEIPAAMFRYALRHDVYDFFESERALKALPLEKIDHLTGLNMRPAGIMDHTLILGILANYYQDGRYRTLHDTLPRPLKEPFQGRYIGGIHRYTPGPELQSVDPGTLAGISEPPMDAHRRRHLGRLSDKQFTLPSINPSEIFDFATFRNGFDGDDDLLLINGLASYALPGAILNFSARGYRWLDGARAGTDASAYFNNNAVHVLRTDRWPDGSPIYAAAARRDWLVTWDGGGSVALTLDPFVGMRWQRQVIWVASGLFVVRDTLTATEDGNYQVSVNWLPTYPGKWDGRSMISTVGQTQFRVTPLGTTFKISHEDGSQPVLRQMAQRTMARDDTLVAVTVLQACKDGESFNTPVLGDDNQTLTLTTPGQTATVVRWGHGEETDVEVIDASHHRHISQGQVITAPAPKGLLEQLVRDTANVQAGDEITPQAAGANAATDDSVDFIDAADSAVWSEQWVNSELQSPGRVYPQKTLAGNVADFGRTITLNEIRAYRAGGPWAPATLPDDIFIRTDHSNSSASEWRKLESPVVWRPGARTGNYGESVPVEQFAQMIDAEDAPVRYIKADRLNGLAFYDRDTPADDRRYTIQRVELDGGEGSQLLVSPEIWPKFVRRGQLERDTFGVFNMDGSLRYRHTAQTNYQTIQTLDYLGSGHPQIVTASIDGQIEVLDANGKRLREFDLYQAHVAYDREYGRTNTRQPAGGFVMPYDIGLWRTSPNEPAGLIVSRYGWFSFIDHQGAFDGLLTAGSYVMPTMLDQPRDFNRDGKLEQLCLSYGRLWHVTGPRDQRVPQPGGYYYYPQVYHTQGMTEPVSINVTVDGTRPIAMQVLSFGGNDRYVLVVRSNYLAIYDARQREWVFTWQPLVEITSAAILQDASQSLRLLVFTRDRLLWDLSWKRELKQLHRYRADAFADNIQAIASTESGGAILCGDRGLYLQDSDGKRTRIAEGTFTDAVELPNGIAAVTNDARVMFFGSNSARNQ